MHYEYNYLHQNSNKDITPTEPPKQEYKNQEKFTERSIYISPVRKWQDKPLFLQKHYYMKYKVELKGNDIGFPDDTLIQITSKTGGIIKVSAPKTFRLKTYEGEDATIWENKENPQSTLALFIDGPGKDIFGTLSVTILSIGTPITNNDIKIISDSKDSQTTSASYNKNVEWEN